MTTDLHAAGAFLDFLETNGVFTFQTFDDSAEKRPELARVLHGTLQQHAEELTRLNEQGAGVFVTVNATDGRGRKTQNVTGLRALFVDADDVPMPATWHVQPDGLVHRSSTRWHGYWRIKSDTPLAAFTPAQKRLAAYYGTDPKVFDLPRVMRIPGFLHRKQEPPEELQLDIMQAATIRTIDEVLAGLPPLAQAEALPPRPAPSAADQAHQLFAAWAAKVSADATEGNRNNTVFKIAAEGAGRGLPEHFVLAICQQHANGLKDPEIKQAMRSAFSQERTAHPPEPRARPSPQTPGQEQQAEPSAAPWPLITDVAVILAHAQPRPKVIVENLIYAGSKVSFSGPSKARKTFFQLHFCLCVALGREWYGLATTQGRVLYVNLELHPFSFQDRVQAILKRLDATLPEGVLDVWHLRGLGVTIERLQSELARRVQQDSYSLLCFDPLYKCLGARSENSAAEMGDLLIRLEGIGHSAGAATLVSHHYSKGLASGKEAIDRSSGSGVVGRDGDAILMLTPHEADDCFTLEAIVRDFPPLAPFVLRWNYPCFEPDQRLDPKNLKKQVSSQPRVTQEDVLAVVTSTPATRENIVQALMKRTGRGENACRAAFTQAETANLLQVEKLPRKGNRPILRYFK